jgi:foldase protein PrsA
VPLLVRTPIRILLALSAFFVVAVALAACGGSSGVPGNAVASVDGDPITKADYDKWAELTFRGTVQGARAVVPDPPNFARCVAALQKIQDEIRVRRVPKLSAATLRVRCRQQHEQLVQQTMTTLIQQMWVEKEADEQGVTVTDAELHRQLVTTKRQSFPSEEAFQRFLRVSGMTQADVEERIRVQALGANLMRKIQNSAAPVTDAQVRAYYERNKAQFAVPERRDVELILTRSEAQANAAKSAVQGGTSWAAAARRYSTDAASKATGGVLRGVSEGQQDRAFDQAAFRASKGEIVGPVKGQFGWYVLRVVRIDAARQTSFADAAPQIRALLDQQAQQQKTSTFITDFQRRWRDKTDCRTGYVVELCSNAPKTRTASTAGGTVATSPSTQGSGSNGR